ncbi:MAG: hypothetical protein LBR38_10085 [Synergistaceae bacterium]|nr:hypothetical protein [Synergistaceae bacterium]
MKRKSILAAALALGLAVLAAPAFASEKLFIISPTAGWYMPTDSKTQNAFGRSWFQLGVSVNLSALGLSSGRGEFKLSPYFGYYHANENGNDADIIPLGLEMRWRLPHADRDFSPYLGVGAALYGVRFEDRGAGVDTGWRSAVGGRIAIGADVTKWFTLQAAYNYVSDVQGYDLSGFSVTGKLNIYF